MCWEILCGKSLARSLRALRMMATQGEREGVSVCEHVPSLSAGRFLQHGEAVSPGWSPLSVSCLAGLDRVEQSQSCSGSVDVGQLCDSSFDFTQHSKGVARLQHSFFFPLFGQSQADLFLFHSLPFLSPTFFLSLFFPFSPPFFQSSMKFKSHSRHVWHSVPGTFREWDVEALKGDGTELPFLSHPSSLLSLLSPHPHSSVATLRSTIITLIRDKSLQYLLSVTKGQWYLQWFLRSWAPMRDWAVSWVVSTVFAL